MTPEPETGGDFCRAPHPDLDSVRCTRNEQHAGPHSDWMVVPGGTQDVTWGEPDSPTCPVHGTHTVPPCPSLDPDTLARCVGGAGHDGVHSARAVVRGGTRDVYGTRDVEWSDPEPPRVLQPEPGDVAVWIRDVLGVALEPWQERVLLAVFPPREGA